MSFSCLAQRRLPRSGVFQPWIGFVFATETCEPKGTFCDATNTFSFWISVCSALFSMGSGLIKLHVLGLHASTSASRIGHHSPMLCSQHGWFLHYLFLQAWTLDVKNQIMRVLDVMGGCGSFWRSCGSYSGLFWRCCARSGTVCCWFQYVCWIFHSWPMNSTSCSCLWPQVEKPIKRCWLHLEL